jgi:hypothetical protein
MEGAKNFRGKVVYEEKTETTSILSRMKKRFGVGGAEM